MKKKEKKSKPKVKNPLDSISFKAKENACRDETRGVAKQLLR